MVNIIMKYMYNMLLKLRIYQAKLYSTLVFTVFTTYSIKIIQKEKNMFNLKNVELHYVFIAVDILYTAIIAKAVQRRVLL